MAKNLTNMSLEAIEYLCSMIKRLTKVSEAIDDIDIRTDGTFSSVKINTLLNTLEQDCNDYTDRLVANLSRLELKLVTDEADITESNIMYLYKPDGATSYNQYVVIDGNKVLLGTCDIDMTDYYTITQADDKFALKTDFDTHRNDTTIHITQDEKDSYAKKTEVDDKLTQLKNKQIRKVTITDMSPTESCYKITLTDDISFSKILISDLYGGCILINGSVISDYKAFKVVRLSNGCWLDYSPSNNTSNKILSVHYDGSFIYVKFDNYLKFYIEGGYTNIEKTDSLPTGTIQLPILDLTQQTDLTEINTRLTQLENTINEIISKQ